MQHVSTSVVWCGDAWRVVAVAFGVAGRGEREKGRPSREWLGDKNVVEGNKDPPIRESSPQKGGTMKGPSERRAPWMLVVRPGKKKILEMCSSV